MALIDPLNMLQDDIANFHKVDGTLWRGAQPDLAAYPELQDNGVCVVINLRDDPLPMEPEAVDKLGMNYYHYPMSGFERPSFVTVNLVIDAIVQNHNRWNAPIFVHCLHGDDRTGVVCACYRIRECKWTNTAALVEAKLDHMSPFEIFMRDFIEDYR